jgi:hypothetical protein
MGRRRMGRKHKSKAGRGISNFLLLRQGGWFWVYGLSYGCVCAGTEE